ncbi:N-terminal acetyltransferase complex subunit [ARD1] [Thermoplasma volcanium GSS1]|uniref:N-terminal acetyltransferase complex subunit [ARD1] n=2 Tax=Thermoplasma volcanium TaxID=50339 RepID=Q97AM8_THEVO|nr:N-terminal acetyltransferase complex subunit [ARD1] [Thermoplasma volcanium GSS1]
MKKEDMESVMDQLLRLKRLNSEFDCIFNVSEQSKADIEKYINKIMNSDDHVLLVAELDNKITGILFADILFRIYYEPKYEARIREFYVMPEYRRNGIGKKLIDALKRELDPKGITFITAEFPALNLIAQNFYKKIGYREIVTIYGQIH